MILTRGLGSIDGGLVVLGYGTLIGGAAPVTPVAPPHRHGFVSRRRLQTRQAPPPQPRIERPKAVKKAPKHYVVKSLAEIPEIVYPRSVFVYGEWTTEESAIAGRVGQPNPNGIVGVAAWAFTEPAIVAIAISDITPDCLWEPDDDEEAISLAYNLL